MSSRIIKSNKYGILTVQKYQEINAINSNSEMDDTDKVLYSVCSLFNYQPEILNNENPKKVVKLISRFEKVFAIAIKKTKFIKWFKINYDIEKITFGQYIELAYFFQFDEVDKAHYLVASISKTFYKTSHINRADFFLQQRMSKVISAVIEIKKVFNFLNTQYSSLFEKEEKNTTNNDGFMSFFNKRYGWIYSAERVAEYEKITVEETYNLPVKKALGDLVYLKAKDKYVSIL
jgi:hypothetical protein